jgi:tRNA nucleotidyltransferase/poly(A) polymerase
MSRDDDPRLRELILHWLAQHTQNAYLVGGCVRDRLLGRPFHDLDLVVEAGGLSLARRLADRFGGAYFPLDEVRGTGRVLLRTGEGTPLVVDVCEMRRADRDADLADRDFTVNALAEDLAAPGAIVDRHHGLDDLNARVIRPVSPVSIRNDPLRALRAVRLAAELGFSLAPETEAQIRQDGPALAGVADERIRDELSRILLQPLSAPWLGRLDDLGLLAVIFPEIEALRELDQPAPHYLSGLAHTLETVRALEGLIGALLGHSPLSSTAGEQREPPWPEPLAPFAPRLKEYLDQPLGADRPRLVSVKLAALLHDTGKPSTGTIDAAGRLRFIGHEKAGALAAGSAARRLRLATGEVRLVEAIVRHHMRPLLLAGMSHGTGPVDREPTVRDGPPVSARAVYRFFRDTGDAGVAVLLHALADHRATHPPGSGDETWRRLLGLAARMFADYFERSAQVIAPPPLLDGHDLQRELGLSPGRQVGELLEALREAQACGEISGRQEALDLARRLVRRAGEGGSTP